ncbi:hypothetical protein [Lactobacillus sp. HT06-2]|uniref:hypothetical protein n=1 Tax=Lactobacillus sp. HT06-2 TaxID=2080222 RepID=UPI000CD9A88F|nr:hypothetical protein [Lactobacillus sp. HT06-2]
MLILTRYKLNGEVIESRFINISEITKKKYSCLGQMTRVTINDGRTYEGFAREPYLSGEGNSLTLELYDIDYETFHLRSDEMTTIFIPVDIVAKIEAISHSNPRWGRPPINEFLFGQDLKQRILDLRNNKSSSKN